MHLHFFSRSHHHHLARATRSYRRSKVYDRATEENTIGRDRDERYNRAREPAQYRLTNDPRVHNFFRSFVSFYALVSALQITFLMPPPVTSERQRALCSRAFCTFGASRLLACPKMAAASFFLAVLLGASLTLPAARGALCGARSVSS